MPNANIYFFDDEWKQIQHLKRKRGLTWRGILLDWIRNNKQ
jgi:hypothetical protein